MLGLCVGPLSTLITPDGSKIIDTTHLFSSEIFFDFVSLSVGIILFEGGLTLRFEEVKKHIGTIRNLLFVGSAIILAFVCLGGLQRGRTISARRFPHHRAHGLIGTASSPGLRRRHRR